MDGVTLLFLLILVAILDGFSCAQTSSIYSGIHCIESEKNALIRFRQGFKNPSRSMLPWMLEENCCRWEGVECDNSTGHVITLDLHKQFLQGEFGISLLGLPHLSHLDLSQNDFLGAKIPNFVSRFKNLEYLNLSKTNFRGTVPEHLGNLSRLQFLDLSGDSSLQVNNLQWLQHLFSMKILDLSDVDMSRAKNWLHDINLLTSLLELRMSACQLATLPKSLPAFVNFTSLRILDLSLNYFNSSIPSWLFNTSHSLVYLNLTRSELGGLLPNALGNMHSLRILDLSGNPVNHRHYFFEPPLNWFTGNLPPALPSKLKYLDVSNNHLEGPLAKSIAQLRQLVVLKVAGNSFNDSITEHFLNFSDLRVLDLSSNSFILNVSATWMPRFQLVFLSLQSCRLGTQFPQWIQTQKKLSFIDISNATISGEVPDWFWNLSAKAYHINLSHNNFRGEVPEFTERLNLKELDLSGNNFHGPLPHFSPKMMTLILANNFFNGTIAPICESLVMNNSLGLLDISSNSLSGQLSDCWRYGKTLELLNLAHNNLSGEIPHSIEDSALRSLNLSRNNFTGAIPRDIGNLLMLESLDLSRNKLSCSFPPSIAELPYLVLANFSFNDLTGKIPFGSQFATFENNSYVGNPNLCGLPLSQVCPDHLLEDMTHRNNEQAVQHGENNNWLEEFSFYISMGIGFNTGFWVFWYTLMLKKSWRYAYMRCLDNMGNKIYVFAAIRLKNNKQQEG